MGAPESPVKTAKTSLEIAKEKIARNAGVIRNVLASPDGEKMMKILEDAFYHGEMYSPDPYRMAFNLGARDVVVYLRQLAKYGESANGNGS